MARALGGRKSGSAWVAKCPAHEDNTPSLSIADSKEQLGRVLVRCHAGCSQIAVLEALKAAGLWHAAMPLKPSRIVATYQYVDECGSTLYEVVRKEPGRNGTKKDFFQRYADQHGDWIWKKHPRQILYHLPEVVENPIIFLVEGEKDVETLRNHGFVATTAAGGADAPWLPQFTSALSGREVNIIPDNDQPGWNRAATVAKALLGHASRIRVLDLPENTKDISDWFDAGHSECELIAMLEGVHAV